MKTTGEDNNLCRICKEPLQSPFAQQRGVHTECAEKADDNPVRK